MPSVWHSRAWITSRLWKLSHTVSCPGLLLAERIAHPSSIIPSGLNIYTEGEQHHISTTHPFTYGRATSTSGVRPISSVRNAAARCHFPKTGDFERGVFHWLAGTMSFSVCVLGMIITLYQIGRNPANGEFLLLVSQLDKNAAFVKKSSSNDFF